MIAVKASFPLGGGDVTVTGASVSLEDGSLVEAKIDLPSGTPIAEKMTVRVEKRGEDWVIVEVLD